MPPLNGAHVEGHRTLQLCSFRGRVGQIVRMQQVAYSDVLDPSTTKMERAALMRAWDILQDRLRELAGRPKAGSRIYKVEVDGRIIDVGAARPAQLRRRGRPPNTATAILDVVAPSNEPGAAQSVDPA